MGERPGWCRHPSANCRRKNRTCTKRNRSARAPFPPTPASQPARLKWRPMSSAESLNWSLQRRQGERRAWQTPRQGPNRQQQLSALEQQPPSRAYMQMSSPARLARLEHAMQKCQLTRQFRSSRSSAATPAGVGGACRGHAGPSDPPPSAGDPGTQVASAAAASGWQRRGRRHS